MFTEAEVKAAKDYAVLFLMNGYVVETYEGDGGWITVECRVYPDKDSVDDILHQIREDEEGRLFLVGLGLKSESSCEIYTGSFFLSYDICILYNEKLCS